MTKWMQIGFSAIWIAAATAGLAEGKTQARLILATESARPGETLMAGVRLTMPAGWHTYWRNAGDAGSPTTIQWTLPEGISAGEILWPLPEKYTDAGLTTYTYQREVVLLVPLSVASNTPSGSHQLQAKVDWLECKESCLPGSATVAATLTVGQTSRPSGDAALIQGWKGNLPAKSDSLAVSAVWEGPSESDKRTLAIRWETETKPFRVDFFPYAAEEVEIEGKTELLSTAPGKVELRKTVVRFGDDWPPRIQGLLMVQRDVDGPFTGHEVTLAMASEPPRATGDVGSSDNAQAQRLAAPVQSLWKMLMYAFVGGLILNLMPCVLPVIALKILGFVSHSRESPRHVRILGMLYGVGVLTSFLVLALVVIGVKAAGKQAGWGMQFGNPVFLVALTVLVTLVALNLFGLFEVTLGGRAMGAASVLTAKEGAGGAFFNGVLATVLATPCTAPFLGVALGFAFAASPLVIILVLLTVGVGLAAPYVVLSYQPAWLRFLPKPGAWMEKFKVAMGFPMLATAVWLFNLAATHYGKKVLWLGLFLVVLALAAWVFGEFAQRGRKRRRLAWVVSLLLLALGYGYALEGQLHWRSPIMPAAQTGNLKESPDGIEWQPWSLAAVAKARAEGRPVFVDFTADWCLTCQANKKTSIEIASVRAKLKAINAVALLGDYTLLPDNITAELNRHGRAGVPLVLVYPRSKEAPPLVLPEVLTPQTVLDALDKAGA